MELHQLRYVVAVAEEGSFTAAAQRELVAQPAVSAAVRSLERELGVQLFRRGRSGAQPTEAGVAVLAHARAALAAVAAARDVADEVTGLLRGRVAVGMVVGCTSTVLADLLADFSTAHPAVEVVLVEGSGADLLAALSTGRLDLAWVGRAQPPPSGVETAVLHEEEQVAVVPVAGPPRGRSLAVAELASHRLVALPRGTGGRTALDAACAAAGVAPVVACEATGLEMVCLLAERGLGTGVVPASVAAAAADRLRALPLDPPVTSRIELAWRTGGPSSPAGAALLAVARRHVEAARKR
ncbi:DNA-binding transcriptional regulator, LysR family [Geodermatophilus siccatus]|uniref:DNA-binding transcriptional regulator, LysR family n=1 Tax=Geodermatophilus siccatus TaxID=1137991 RepID=A0A1G9UYJ1_9ACTN|nr:LysR family transcriptional regulator [Geodermatophilus siccatus]SDM65044.1 DNA-binding transcriptional regulator, LysR family [Geodermatophilus siccatus]